MTNIIKPLGLAMAVALLSTGGHARADLPIYSTGFESPQFTTAPIGGQDGWNGDGQIENSVVYSGSQALHIDADTSNFQKAGLPQSAGVVGDVFTIQVEFQDKGPGTAQAGIGVFGDTGFLSQIYVGGAGGSDGYILGNEAGGTPVPAIFANGAWHQLTMVLDFQTETVTGYVDGQDLGTIALILPSGPTTKITDVWLYSNGSPGTAQDLYYDNLSMSLTAAPEPSSAPFFVLGLAALASVRRAKLPRRVCPEGGVAGPVGQASA